MEQLLSLIFGKRYALVTLPLSRYVRNRSYQRRIALTAQMHVTQKPSQRAQGGIGGSRSLPSYAVSRIGPDILSSDLLPVRRTLLKTPG
jgi:hypothetical protein